jgi:hypothetical protein
MALDRRLHDAPATAPGRMEQHHRRGAADEPILAAIPSPLHELNCASSGSILPTAIFPLRTTMNPLNTAMGAAIKCVPGEDA